MKKVNLLLVGGIVLVVVALIITVCCLLLGKKPEEPQKIDNLLMCSTKAELVGYVEENNIPFEDREDKGNLYNVPIFENLSYVIADYSAAGGKIIRFDAYLTVNDEKNYESTANAMKDSLLSMIAYGESAEFEYFPIDDPDAKVGKDEFMNGLASRELCVYKDGTEWRISCNIAGENMGIRISKVVS